MSKKNTTTTIVPAASTRAVTPKPTKSEIIEALTRLKVEELEAANEIKEDAIASQRAVIQNLALQELSAHLAMVSPFIAEKGEVRYQRGYGSNYVEFSVRVTSDIKDSESYSNAVGVKASKALIAEFAKLEKLPSTNWIREDEIRKEIRKSLTQDAAGRVTRLLEDSESRAALSDLLKVVESGIEKRVN
jgi:hypothetical protein